MAALLSDVSQKWDVCVSVSLMHVSDEGKKADAFRFSLISSKSRE